MTIGYATTLRNARMDAITTAASSKTESMLTGVQRSERDCRNGTMKRSS